MYKLRLHYVYKLRLHYIYTSQDDVYTRQECTGMEGVHVNVSTWRRTGMQVRRGCEGAVECTISLGALHVASHYSYMYCTVCTVCSNERDLQRDDPPLLYLKVPVLQSRRRHGLTPTSGNAQQYSTYRPTVAEMGAARCWRRPGVSKSPGVYLPRRATQAGAHRAVICRHRRGRTGRCSGS